MIVAGGTDGRLFSGRTHLLEEDDRAKKMQKKPCNPPSSA